MILNLPTKPIKAMSHANNFHCLTYKIVAKPAGIDVKRNYVIVTLCTLHAYVT